MDEQEEHLEILDFYATDFNIQSIGNDIPDIVHNTSCKNHTCKKIHIH